MALNNHGAPYVSSIRDFLFPRHDERVEAELGRSYRIAFCVLSGILLAHIVLNMFLVMWEMQFTEPGDPMPVSGGVVSWVEYFALLIAFILMSILQIRKGAFITGRWRTPDGRFPVGYACATSALIALLVGAVAMLTRVYVEVHYVGWANVTWAGDIAIMMFDTILLFGVLMVVMFASFKAAQKREAQMLNELESDD